MKKALLSIVAVLIILFVVPASSEGNRQITFDFENDYIYAGVPVSLAATVERLTDDAPQWTGIVWSSSDESIARVNGYGSVTGVSAGKVTITASAQDDPAIYKSIEVDVRVPVKSIQIDPATAVLFVGASDDLSRTELNCVITPEDAFDKEVIWTSSDEAVVTVDDNGNVQAHAKGNAVIYAESSYGDGRFKSSCRVAVGQAVTEIQLNETDISLAANRSFQLAAQVLPQDANDKRVAWASSDESVAVVNAQGGIRGVSEGHAVITATSMDGGNIVSSCEVSVYVPVQRIVISEGYQFGIAAGFSYSIVPTVEPENATNRGLVWTSSDEEVATVDQNGVVTGKAMGRATITATAADGSNVTGATNVVVSKAVESVEFDAVSLIVPVNKSAAVKVTVSPADAGNKNLTWSSENEEIATVNNNGQIVGNNVGTTIVRASSMDGTNIVASITVDVVQPVTRIVFPENSIELPETGTYQSQCSIEPENATNKVIRWSSDDETVATVDENGVVTAVTAGRTRILATAEGAANGVNPAVLNVVVVRPIATVNLDQSNMEIAIGARVAVIAEIAPEDATNKRLNWISADPSITQVSANGDITGRDVGTTTITGEAADGYGASASVQVTVFKPVQNLRLEKSQLTAFVGKTSDPLVVTVNPADAKYQGYTWSSSDEAIAIVNEKGQVTGVSGGRVNITATSNEPASGNIQPKSVTCQVQVIQAVERIKLEKNNARSNDRNLVLDVTVLPETATNKQVEWSTSDSSIATVSNGVVSIKKKDGSATITAKARDGSGIYASCKVSVGFAGSIIRIGNYERRMGSYYWDVSDFFSYGGMEDLASDVPEIEEGSLALEFASVTETDWSTVSADDNSVYMLKVLSAGDPGINSRAVCFVIKEPVNAKEYKKMVFYIMDMQGSNTHRVTLIDEEGNIHSNWIETKSEYRTWKRIEVPLYMYGDIELSKLAEIRIGEWNVGEYYFMNICLTASD